MAVKIRQKIKGKGNPWWIFISHEGQRKSIKVGDKRTAERKAKTLEKMLKSGQYRLNEDQQERTVTFRGVSKEWGAEIKVTRKASTHERYNQILDSHILPVFGKRGIDSITKGEIKTFLIKKIEDGFSKSSVSVFKDVMSGVFNHAMDQELIGANPTLGITRKLSLEGGKDHHVDPLDFDETKTFLETCRTVYPEHYAFFFMALRTGMRLGELLAVQWGDLDFNSRYIVVRRTYKRGLFTEPKNKKTRQVDMSDLLIDTLLSTIAPFPVRPPRLLPPVFFQFCISATAVCVGTFSLFPAVSFEVIGGGVNGFVVVFAVPFHNKFSFSDCLVIGPKN